MDVTLFVLMAIAFICGSYKGKANLPPPLHGNLAKSVDNYAFANNPMLSDDKRTYEIRFTGEFKDYKAITFGYYKVFTPYNHIFQVRTTICRMLERKGAHQVLDYLIPPSAKKHALSWVFLYQGENSRAENHVIKVEVTYAIRTEARAEELL